MRVWFDTEFHEDGRTIDLISIGLVREDGATLYLESAEFDEPRAQANPWLAANVLPHLGPRSARVSRAAMAQRIVAFVGERPEFWAYYADYDWVVLCQLYGRMIDLPSGWPMYCRDFKQLVDERRLELRKQADREHDALADAMWLRDEMLRALAAARLDDIALRVFAKSLREHNKEMVLRTAWRYLQRIVNRHRYRDGFVEWWAVEAEAESLLSAQDGAR